MHPSPTPSLQRFTWLGLSAVVTALAVVLVLRARAPRAGDEIEAAHLPETFDLARIDAALAAELAARHVVGASVAIVRDGAIVLARGYGKRSLETGAPVTNDTAFAIGSVTKQFTCAAVHLLAEDGKVALSDKVSAFYPDLTRATDISLDDLGAHVSGYPDYFPLDFVDRRMKSAIVADALVREYASRALDFPPRTRWSYSNTGYVILGRVIERTSGKSYDAFLADRLFRPLGMEHTSVGPAARGEVATGYTSFALGPDEPAPQEAEDWLRGAGDIYATASDLARWNLALMNRAVLSDASWRAMSTARTLENGRSASYGCGLFVRVDGGETVLSHDGEVSGFLAYSTLIPRRRAAVVVLVNSDRARVDDLVRGLTKLLLADETRVPKVDGPPAKDVVATLVKGLQAGRIDRSLLAAEYDAYLDDRRLAETRAQLHGLGAPTGVTLLGQSERGGMEVSRVQVTYRSRSITALLYRTTGGRVEELLVFPAAL